MLSDMPRLPLFLLPLLLCGAPLGASPHSAQTTLYYTIAEGNYLIGDLTGAANGVDEILGLDPDHLPALALQARIRLDQDDAAAALVAAEHALQCAPDVLEYQLLKALILSKLKRQHEAIALIQQVIADADAGSADALAAHQLLGLLRMASGDWQAAAQAFDHSYRSAPQPAASSRQLATEAYLEQAHSALNAEQPAEAVQALNRALALYADESGPASLQMRSALRMQRARILTQIGQLDDAIEDLQVLTGQQPDNLEALVMLASLYASTERWSSLNGILAPLDAEPQLKDIALYLQGRAALAQGRAGTARAKFEAALEGLPTGPHRLRGALYFYHSQCLMQLGRSAAADAALLKALDADFEPETTGEALRLARALLRLKRAEQAIPLLEVITLQHPAPNPEAWTLLGRAHLANDATALALSAFNQSLSMQPAQAETRALRGALLRKLGDLEGAAADTEWALSRAPEDGALNYALGMIRFQQGQLAQAAQHIGRAAQQLSDHPGVQLLHALLSYCVNGPASARPPLSAYLALAAENANESALYLQYTLNAHEDLSNARQTLIQHAGQQRSPFFTQFLGYLAGTLERKYVLDQAGIAASAHSAQQQICQAAFWMAQHQRASGQLPHYRALLTLVTETGTPDLPEFQFARWQLNQNQP